MLGAHDGGGACGLVVTAFMSVSLQPPLVALTIPDRGDEGRLQLASQRFTVSILSQEQESLADTYHRPQPMRRGHYRLQGGLPVVVGSLAWLVCTVHERQRIGDGAILVARVEDVGLGEGSPLLRFGDEPARLRELLLSD